MSLDSQSKFQIFTLFSGCMLVSKLGSVNLPLMLQFLESKALYTRQTQAINARSMA